MKYTIINKIKDRWIITSIKDRTDKINILFLTKLIMNDFYEKFHPFKSLFNKQII